MSPLERFVRLLPLPLKAAAKRVAFALDPLYRLVYRVRTGDSRPIPPLAQRAQIGSGHDIGVFFDSGRLNAEFVLDVLAGNGHAVGPGSRVLDFGCGCVRVLSQVEAIVPEADLFGCDVNAPAIEWAAQAHPSLSVAVNGYDPPLPYPDGHFDAIYSLSIFTHLPLDSHEPWLRELDRVLKPGGAALITTSGKTHGDSFASGERVSNSRAFIDRVRAAPPLEEAGALFISYDRTRWNEQDFSGVDRDYGIALLSTDHVHSEWSRVFEILELREGSLAGQDAVVVAKR